MNILATVLLSIALAGSVPAQRVENIQTTETGVLITFENGSGYYWEAE